MLDSSDEKNEDTFDAFNHTQQLCKDTKVSIDHSIRIDYQKGWEKLIKQLVSSIKNQPIMLLRLNEEFGELNVDFKCREKAMEVRVWRAIRTAQLQSVATCTECGSYASRRVRGDNVVVLCRDCALKAEMNGETGTWLDRY